MNLQRLSINVGRKSIISFFDILVGLMRIFVILELDN